MFDDNDKLNSLVVEGAIYKTCLPIMHKQADSMG